MPYTRSISQEKENAGSLDLAEIKFCRNVIVNQNMKRNLFSLGVILCLGTCLVAQNNVSYNINNVPIGGGYNTAFGLQSLTVSIGARNSALGYEALKANTNGFFNTGIGVQALTANTVGAFNTAIGMQSMSATTTGFANSGLGYQTLFSNVSGAYNAASGLVSLSANTTGSNNTAHGAASLYTNTTGSNNTALGYYADVTAANLTNATAIGNEAKVSASNTIQLGNNAVTAVYAGTGTTAKLIAGGLQVTGGAPAPGKVLMSDAAGNATWQTAGAGGSGWSMMGNAGTVDGTNFIGTTDNVALSFRMNNQPAGRIESTNNGNTCFGYRSGNLPGGSGAKNTAIGYYALQANTAGRENVATGYNALKANLGGYYNTASGFGALEANTNAYYNTATGYASLANNTIGGSNTATGSSALYYNTNGFQNTAAGYFALYGNISGAQNTSTGSVSLLANGSGSNNVADGYASLVVNSTGNQNVAIGANALSINTTGSNNTGLGYYADVSTNNLNNATAVGANAVVNASNKVRIGSPAVTVVEGPVAYTISDGRFKTNIEEADVKGLDFIQRLRPVVYNMDTRKFQEFLTQNMADSVKVASLRKKWSKPPRKPAMTLMAYTYPKTKTTITASPTANLSCHWSRECKSNKP
jgi:trimeric autotransporter adhesin